MISTLDDLQHYTEERAAKVPAVGARVLLRSPGLSSVERAQLKQELPGLPSSYLDCATRFRLETVELGMAALRPRPFGGERLIYRLMLANGAPNPIREFLQANGLYEVDWGESWLQGMGL